MRFIIQKIYQWFVSLSVKKICPSFGGGHGPLWPPPGSATGSSRTDGSRHLLSTAQDNFETWNRSTFAPGDAIATVEIIAGARFWIGWDGVSVDFCSRTRNVVESTRQYRVPFTTVHVLQTDRSRWDLINNLALTSMESYQQTKEQEFETWREEPIFHHKINVSQCILDASLTKDQDLRCVELNSENIWSKVTRHDWFYIREQQHCLFHFATINATIERDRLKLLTWILITLQERLGWDPLQRYISDLNLLIQSNYFILLIFYFNRLLSSPHTIIIIISLVCHTILASLNELSLHPKCKQELRSQNSNVSIINSPC